VLVGLDQSSPSSLGGGLGEGVTHGCLSKIGFLLARKKGE
jgi:hypothetical protein